VTPPPRCAEADGIVYDMSMRRALETTALVALVLVLLLFGLAWGPPRSTSAALRGGDYLDVECPGGRVVLDERTSSSRVTILCGPPEAELASPPPR
jgi:hypothetical protein